MHCCVSSQALLGGMQHHPTEEASAVEFVYSVMSSEPKSIDSGGLVKRFLLSEGLYRKLKFVFIMIESSLFDAF